MAKVRSWEISDGFWFRVESLIPKRQRSEGGVYQRGPGGGRKPMEPRQVFERIVFVLRTACQWKALPKERFGSASMEANVIYWWTGLWRSALADRDRRKQA